jgi:hypothetical protein
LRTFEDDLGPLDWIIIILRTFEDDLGTLDWIIILRTSEGTLLR